MKKNFYAEARCTVTTTQKARRPATPKTGGPTGDKVKRRVELRDVQLAKSQANRPGRKRPKVKARKPTKSQASTNQTTSKKKQPTLSQLLSPKNVQETMKTVSNLRGMVKNWLGYLQQADRMLDTVFVTTNSLKESGVLDKLIKSKGKNLSSDDFTSILAALMSSPLASNFLGGGGDNESTNEEQKTQSNGQRQPTGQNQQGLPPPHQPM